MKAQKSLKYFTFYYAGDNLDSEEWEPRSVRQLDGFEKKIEIPKLALDLAVQIDKSKGL